jgi:Zn-finger nucleic acid-binding protein
VALKRLIAQAHQSLAQGAYQRRPIELGLPVQYLRCPACNELMLRHNFGDSSGVIVDVCGKHGVWFDNGELAQALSFCASGQPQALRTLEKYQQQALRRIDAPPLHFEDTALKSQTAQSLGGVLLDILWAVLSLYFP